MGIQVVRFEKEDQIKWGVVSGERIHVLDRTYNTLSELLQEGIGEARTIKMNDHAAETISIEEVTILSPITQPARIVCQGANYGTHRIEAGLPAERPPFNLFFGKADSALTGAYSDIIRPSHVKLLDYEIELGLVIGKNIDQSEVVTDDNLHQYVAGLVIVDDVSSRDLQFSEGQWLKGKSFRTFAPAGPILYLLDQEEMPLIHDLELNLWVNDELRQSANTSQLLFKPAETITELSEIMDLSIGDLVMTGTTGGVALNMTAEFLNQLNSAPINQKLEMVIENQLPSGRYLKDGDVIRCQIKSADGRIDLGEQINKVVSK